MRHKIFRGVLCVAVVAMAGLAWGQRIADWKAEVDFPFPVVVGDRTLPPGHYIFEQVGYTPSTPPAFRVIDSQGHYVALTPIAINPPAQTNAASVPATPDKSEVVVEKIGDQYYLRQIWVRGREYGWEFELPQNVKEKASQGQQQTLQGTYKEMPPKS